MAKKVYVEIVIDDKGTTKKVAVDAKKLGIELNETANSSRKAQ
jgi:regulator of RNase E activity RraB